MVHAVDLHTIFSELHVGSLTLAAVALIGLTFHAIHMHFLRGHWRWLDRLSRVTPRLAVPVAHVGAIFGLIGFTGSIVTGVFTWPARALWSSHEVLNKVMLSTLALELWIIFVWLRLSRGTRVLTSRRLLHLYLGIGFVAFGLTTTSASLGGHLAGKESLLDPLYSAINIDTSAPWILLPFAWLIDLVYRWPPLSGLPIQSIYRLLLLVDLAVVVAIVLLVASVYRKPRVMDVPDEALFGEVDPCHPDPEGLLLE
ncbi:MAG: hypothetical protein GTO63_13610 [Anaerolineae bacterium]|nr:hypothetical protein [Anaerolineae bacterium]